jgi:hypothetical protein
VRCLSTSEPHDDFLICTNGISPKQILWQQVFVKLVSGTFDSGKLRLPSDKQNSNRANLFAMVFKGNFCNLDTMSQNQPIEGTVCSQSRSLRRTPSFCCPTCGHFLALRKHWSIFEAPRYAPIHFHRLHDQIHTSCLFFNRAFLSVWLYYSRSRKVMLESDVSPLSVYVTPCREPTNSWQVRWKTSPDLSKSSWFFAS